jgi:hypothetical protein
VFAKNYFPRAKKYIPRPECSLKNELLFLFLNVHKQTKTRIFQEAHRKHTYVPNKLFRQKVKQFVFNVVFPVGTNTVGMEILYSCREAGENVSCKVYFFPQFLVNISEELVT